MNGKAMTAFEQGSSLVLVLVSMQQALAGKGEPGVLSQNLIYRKNMTCEP